MNNDYLKYAGMAFQFMAMLALAIFFGYKVDAYFAWRFPFALIIFPLIIIFVLLFRIIQDTKPK